MVDLNTLYFNYNNCNFLFDNSGWRDLMFAARHGHTEAVQALVRAPGINVNQQDVNGTTALIAAARLGHTAIVQALLAVDGIDVNQANAAGMTALMCAGANGFRAIVQALNAVAVINRPRKRQKVFNNKD